MKKYFLGSIGGLNLTYDQTAVIGSMVLWIGLAAAGMVLFDLSLVEGILGGAAAVLLHWLSELLHQAGHARAARKTGYPMTGVHFFLILGRSIYPPDEGNLPGYVHVRRALGGPQLSLLVTVAAGITAAILNPMGGVVAALALFFLLDNLFIFTLGAFLPLGFTDGSTILYWRNR
ncbi:MAG: hypothetical protein K8I82_10865 [Anaerolineae bacterium]|nr:hypothetical protein [Anaerolineae bacterium]